jgi:outer membrane receptor protein involved in Fe transport
MKKLLLITLTSLFSMLALGQNTQPTITISGTVIDSLTKQPVSYVTAALQDAKTQAPIQSTLAKEDGSITLTAPAGKPYQLVLVFVGYKNKTIPVTGTGPLINLDKIILSASNKTLGAVSITAPKPLMKQEVDRLSYDVQADPESKTITALDMIRKVPLLSVDATDNIKLRGSGDYKILINGKESALMAKNPSDILKAMPASNIVKIEVITTPPAKYDAEGLAGIINIITTKNATQGYNGSVNGGYNSVYGYRANLNLSIKEGKLGYTGYAGSGNRPNRASDFENLSSFFTPVPSSLAQQGSRGNSNKNVYAGNELSYEIDSLNLLTGTFNFYNGSNTQNSSQFTTQSDVNNAVTQAYHTQNNGTGDFKGSDLGLNYQLGFKNNKNELLTASYKFSKSDNQQNNAVNNDQRVNYTTPDYRQYNSSGSKEHTTQLDYIDPLKIVTIEAGGKMILRNNYSNSTYNTFNAATGQYVDNGLQDNNFTYNQDVYSIYNSYQLKYTKWTFKGGLRFERTNVHADFTLPKSSFDQGYNNLVPSFSAQRTLTTTSSLTFGFTQRIQRPGIYQLNPFVDSSNNKYIRTGNPNLRPAVNNNFELSYGNFAKGSINISTHYSFVNNSIQNVTAVGPNDVTTTTYANVGQNRNLGLDININYPLTKKMNLNINAELLQAWIKGTYNGSFYTNSGQQGYIFTYTDYKFDNGVRLGMNLGFDSRYVLLQGRDNYYFNNSYSASKDILDKKGTISLSVSNPWRKFNKIDFFTKTPDFETYNSNQNYYRTIYIGFNYKFGKLNSEIKKAQRGINNDDTSSGGRN